MSSVLLSLWLVNKPQLLVCSSCSHSPEHKHVKSADLCHASWLQTSRFSSAHLSHLLLSIFWRHVFGGGSLAQWRECTGHICGDASCVDERSGCVFCWCVQYFSIWGTLLLSKSVLLLKSDSGSIMLSLALEVCRLHIILISGLYQPHL